MNSSAVFSIELLHDLYRQCVMLMVLNALLSGIAVYLAWRSSYWRTRSEQMEQEWKQLREQRNQDDPTPVQPLPTVRPPVPRLTDLRRIPATKFPHRLGSADQDS
jgi:hypothetical protein